MRLKSFAPLPFHRDLATDNKTIATKITSSPNVAIGIDCARFVIMENLPYTNSICTQ